MRRDSARVQVARLQEAGAAVTWMRAAAAARLLARTLLSLSENAYARGRVRGNNISESGILKTSNGLPTDILNMKTTHSAYEKNRV